MRRRIKQAKVLHVVSVDDCKRYVLPRKDYGKNTIHNFDFSFRIITIENKPYFFRHEICACVGCKGCYVEEAVKHYFSEVDNSFMLYTVAFSQFAPKTEQLVVYDEEVTIAALKNMIDSSWNALEYCKPQLDVIDFIKNVALPDWYKDKSVQTFTNNETFNYFSIRAVTIDGQPYFVGVDVAKALGYKSLKDALTQHVDAEDKIVISGRKLEEWLNYRKRQNTPDDSGAVYKPSEKRQIDKQVLTQNAYDDNDAVFGIQKITLINEAGLYSLIFGSELPSAKKFKRWVMTEVLPSIRKTGSYSMTRQLKGGDE